MDKSVKTSWKKKMDLKNETKVAKQYEQGIKAAKQQIIEVFISIVDSIYSINLFAIILTFFYNLGKKKAKRRK